MDPTKDYWDTRARQYGLTAPGFGGKATYDKITIQTFDQIADCNSLLDIGCGTGRLYDVLSRHCKQYTGVDFSEEMLKLFKQHHSLRIQDRIELVDAAVLPYPEASFDAVVSNVVLQHIIDHEKFLQVISEIKRVLKPDGILYLCESMSEGIPISQPFPSYQRIRPREMYAFLFQPEIPLEESGIVYISHHFLMGTRKTLQPRPEKMIIDVGCGKEKRHGAIGIDLRRVDRHGLRMTDVVADACNLPFANRQIDEVWCRNLLEHYENPYPLLIELYRVVKIDGTVYILVPYPGTQSAEADPTHKFILSPANWATLLAGFFGKIVCVPHGTRFHATSTWVEWQKKLIAKGLHDFAQGGFYICTLPHEIPEIRYVPWWLEDYVKTIAGKDMV